tara:strand:+ start:290027 stop:290365 length:339 start_codon:yes stop_codon:yes gene_type:complete
MTNTSARRLQKNAPLFAALGDKTRLSLLVKLGEGQLHSVTSLAKGASLSRQAIRKHLSVLEDVGMVHGVKQGREHLFRYDPKPIEELRLSLAEISRQWDESLLRLKAFVEEK